MTTKGCINIETFWILHFAKFNVRGPCLIIYDGAESHLDHRIVGTAEQHEIGVIFSTV